MPWGWIILSLIIGGAAGWAGTYGYFKMDKIRRKIAAEMAGNKN